MKKNDLSPEAFRFEGKMSLKQALPLGMQHVLAMFVGNLTPLLIITGACGLAGGEFADLRVTLLQNAMLVAGIVTLVQLYSIGPIGGKVLFFDSIDEMRNQTGSHGPNYLRNHTAERDYFSPLSIVTSIQKPQEYLFSNYMDAWSFCVHTPNKHEFFHETYMHKHNFFELMYVQRGQVRVMIEGAETTYTQGNLCLLNRNTMHRETDMSNADIVYIGIDASLLTQWPKSFPPPFQYKSILNQFFSDNLSERADYKKDYLDFTLLGEDTIPQLTQELIRAFTVKRIGYQFDVYSSLLRLFAALENPDIYKATHISLRNSQELLAAEQVKKLIETHHGAIQRTNLAEALNYSCEHISRIIKTNTGYTLKAYCQKVQMAEAARLLRTTELPVCQIAASMGYENRTQFYKVFRREYGLTPLEYRRHIAEE